MLQTLKYNKNDVYKFFHLQTLKPIVVPSNGKVIIDCATEGASIGYKIIRKDDKRLKSWNVYQGPFKIQEGSGLLVKAHRIGFKPSETIEIKSI